MSILKHDVQYTPRDRLKAAEDYVVANLYAAAREYLDWQNSGILEDGHMRAVARALQPVMTHDALKVAENILYTACLRAVVEELSLTPDEAETAGPKR